MGALKGSVAVRRYVVVDPLPTGELRQKFTRGVRAHTFIPLDPKGDQDRSVGWVSILDSNDTELGQEKLFFNGANGEEVRLALRIDLLKPPAAEVRRQLESKVGAKEAELGRPVTRREKSLLREEVVRALRQRSFPRVRVTDLVWNFDTRRIYLWSHQKPVNETFVDLFVKSFGLRIEVEGAPAWARSAAGARELERLVPTPELWLGFAEIRPLSEPREEG